jgi:sugar lactone lactonase YvrE
MKVILVAAALSVAIVAPAAAEHGHGKVKGHKPAVIQLPQNFNPEGIATAKRHTFFVGSRTTGAIYRGSLRTGEGAILVEGGPDAANDDRGATGLKVDRFGRLFASGADSKHIRVYDARTGAQLRDYSVGAEGSFTAGFINDVIVTKRGAYFTDSNNPWLYFIPFGEHGALGDLQRITLGGDYVNETGFNANGIVAARGGKSLIVVKSNTGELFDVDAATGVADRIEVTGGDGELFKVPTTMARSGGRNYVVNAKFPPFPNPDGSFEVVKVPKR